MVKRHKGRFMKAVVVASDPATPVPAAANRSDAPPAFDAEPASVTAPAASPRDALLGTVSPEALQVAPAAFHAAPVEDAAVIPAEPAEVPPTSIDVEAAPREAALEETPIPAEAAVEPPLPAPPVVEPLALVAAPVVETAPKPLLDAVAEFTQANAAVVAFLQGESRATLSHWRALAAAKTPADAIRLQVGEMQRAADASLTCFSMLAKRATRFAEAVRPR